MPLERRDGVSPDAIVQRENSDSVRLSELWEDATVLLVFLRHFG